jgi:uncharacterized oxidoreductase
MNIAGKTAVVTGGTDGIGLEIARQLKAKGAHVIVCGRREEALASARSEDLEALSADLSAQAGVDNLVEALRGRDIDIVVNNAGMGVDFDFNGAIDLDGTERTIYLNLHAPIRLAAALIPLLRTRPEAALVNVTSGLAIAPRAGGPVYCATKAGLRSFTKAIRYQLRNSSVRVIEALPPVVETAMTVERTGRKMSPAACAAEIVAAIGNDRNEAKIGIVKLLGIVHSISPKLAEAIMIRF